MERHVNCFANCIGLFIFGLLLISNLKVDHLCYFLVCFSFFKGGSRKMLKEMNQQKINNYFFYNLNFSFLNFFPHFLLLFKAAYY